MIEDIVVDNQENSLKKELKKEANIIA